jgi:prostaglandin-endoperoxide synthase 2
MSDLWGTDGFKNGLRLYAVTHFAGLWRFLGRVPGVRSAANQLIINQMIYTMKTRPTTLSTMSPYTSWDSLTDRTYSDRHLPPDPDLQKRLPSAERAAELFMRPPDGARYSPKSTLLFPHFAQWFTDGFLRTDPTNPLKNTSTHDIDLSQLYGQTRKVTDMLREKRGGRLKSQMIDGREYPPYLFGEDGQVKPEFADLPISFPGSDRKAVALDEIDEGKRRRLFAVGIPRGNIHYGFSMMSTLFLREHNRLAGAISAEHPDWDDERAFQTARNTLIVILMEIVIGDYINHISPFYFRLFVDPGIGVHEKWYRQNWMSIEFDLLYRWHALVPTHVTLAGEQRDMADVLWDTEFVTANGIARLFDEASRQPSTEIGLLNSAAFLAPAERHAIEIGRTAQLASFNDYRQAAGFPRLASFEEISSDPAIRSALADRYATVDDVELLVGLFAEDVRRNAALPTLMGTMVGVDAFSQALTNPLLATELFTEATFSAAGMDAIRSTRSLADLVARNVAGEHATPLVTFTQPGWRPA